LKDENTEKIYEKPIEVCRLGESKSTFLKHNPIGNDPEAGLRL